jgi:1-phosphofructokinase family hexose kinase
MILCLTLNPAIDRTLVVSRLRPGEVHRTARVVVAAGGKGLNVARAIRVLGGEPLCMGFLGGHSGRLLAELAGREGLRGAWTWIEGETRTCAIVLDEASHEATVFNEQGPAVPAGDWPRLMAAVLRESEEKDIVCASGSLPPGSPPELFAELLTPLARAGKQVWVDTGGSALKAAIGVGGINVKVNGDEAGAVLNGEPATTVNLAVAAARELNRRGAGNVVITLGSLGAVMASGSESFHAQPPTIEVTSAVGSGDSFLGGLMNGLAGGATMVEALKAGTAAGAANALAVGGGRFAVEDFNRILAATTCSRWGLQ